jgi:hypothetical protein
MTSTNSAVRGRQRRARLPNDAASGMPRRMPFAACAPLALQPPQAIRAHCSVTAPQAAGSLEARRSPRLAPTNRRGRR